MDTGHLCDEAIEVYRSVCQFFIALHNYDAHYRPNSRLL